MFKNFVPPSDLIPSDPRFGVGPSKVPFDHLQSLIDLGPKMLGTSHRKPAIIALMKELQDNFRSYMNIPDDFVIAVTNGGATALFDSIVLNMCERKAASFICGVFGQIWADTAKNIPGIEVEEFTVPYGECINPHHVDGADLICVTHCETSTGAVFNQLPENRDDVIVAVDGTSAAGQFEIDFSKVDVYFFSAQKIMGGDGSTAVIIMSPKAVKRVRELNGKRYIPFIMNLNRSIDMALKHQPSTTPSVISIWLLNEQLKAMIKSGGLKNAVALAKKKQDLISNWVKEKDYLSFFIKDEQFRAHSVSVVNVDEKYDIPSLLDRLESLGVVNGIAGYRSLKMNQMRIGLFFNIDYDDLVILTKLISYAIEHV